MFIKPAAMQNFSVLTFGIAQVAMDIEPGLGMLLGWQVLHGPSHTIAGALVIALLVIWVSPAICKFILSRYNAEVLHYQQDWLLEPGDVSRTAVLSGAFIGTLSHIALDSLMHHDMHPLAPFSQTNPLIDLISHDGVYQLCVALGVLGILVWLMRKWIQRTRKTL